MSPLCSTGITMTSQNIPVVPQSAGTSWPLLAGWKDKAWLSSAMSNEESFGLAEREEMERQPSPTVTPTLSALDELGERAPCDAAVQEWKEERDVQLGSEGHETTQVPPGSNKTAGEPNEFTALHFPQKLWKLVESPQFQSIWWSAGGKCVAINEGLFKEEVLGRGGPQRVFGMNSMKSFLRQMNLYGFTKVRQDFQRSASLPEFLAEEAAASAHSQILYYYNPSFNRNHPHLLESCKRRVGVKRRAPDAPAVDEGHPSTSPGGWPAGDIPAPTKRWAEAPPSLTSIPPPPPAAAPTLPQPAGAAGSQRLIPLTLFFLPPPSSQAPEGLQDNAQAAPCFPVPVLAAASALLGPRPPHCPTCTCTHNPADGPQHGTS